MRVRRWAVAARGRDRDTRGRGRRARPVLRAEQGPVRAVRLALDHVGSLRGVLLRRVPTAWRCARSTWPRRRTPSSRSASGHTLSKRIPIILYSSHNDFSQTNVTPELIDGSTGGFTELLRDRVVVPFTGSYEDFRHVLVHELVHAFQFDILYNGTGMSLLSGQGFFQMPLWFAEGMAEYFSLGMEPNAEMWCRDGALTGYIPPLEYMGGYPVYKFGQSAIEYLHRRATARSASATCSSAPGRCATSTARSSARTACPCRKFDETVAAYLRKRLLADGREARLSRDVRQAADRPPPRPEQPQPAPAVSPQGDRIAYFSDRRQYTDLYLMSAFDGKVLRRVVRGERNVQFETCRCSAARSPGRPTARRSRLTAKSAGHDRLYVVDARTGRRAPELRAPLRGAVVPGVVARVRFDRRDRPAARPLGPVARGHGHRGDHAPDRRRVGREGAVVVARRRRGSRSRPTASRPSCCSRSRSATATAATACSTLDLATRQGEFAARHRGRRPQPGVVARRPEARVPDRPRRGDEPVPARHDQPRR